MLTAVAAGSRRQSRMPRQRIFATGKRASSRCETAPDGSIVRPLVGVDGGTMAHFTLPAGGTSRAVVHRSVEELWFVVAGRGELWRKQGHREEVIALEPGVCATVPRGTHFQFRASLVEAVEIVAVTIPRWPGNEEAVFVAGPWPPAPSCR
jgi:mannose-6-phosphate isomerase-like protein (cupin superfamily)